MQKLLPPAEEIARLLEFVCNNNASDLHLKVHYPPFVRIGGNLRKLDSPPLPDTAYVEAMIIPLMSAAMQQIFAGRGGADFAIRVESGNRFRINAFRSGGDMHAALRRVQNRIPDFESLNLPTVYRDLISKTHVGLILVNGVTGSGKSSTLAAMLNHINHTRAMHIITIEDPVEYIFHPEKSIISQREIGIDVADFQDALRFVVRQDPDCIMIGELRDKETMLAALKAAETGHLVLASIHSADVQLTFSRILEFFPAEEHAFIRSSLASSLRAILSQRLLPGLDENSRLPVTEVLLVNAVIREKIIESEDELIHAIMCASHEEGMRDFTRSLLELVNNQVISRETGLEFAPNREHLLAMLKGIATADGLITRLKH